MCYNGVYFSIKTLIVSASFIINNKQQAQISVFFRINVQNLAKRCSIHRLLFTQCEE